MARSLLRSGRSAVSRLLQCGLWTLHQYPPKPLLIPKHYHGLRGTEPAPRISIVTPSYNSVSFIEQTLRSVLEQRYSALEYICQDGASTDGTIEIINSYAPHLHVLNSEPDRGQTHALNRGFAYATGDILAYLNSDDILLPGALHYVASFFQDRPDIDVIYSHRVMIDEEGHEVGRWILPRHNDRALQYADYVPQETMFWRRDIFQKIGGQFDESFQFAMDWDLILRFRAAGARFARVPRLLGAFRVHSAQKSQAVIEEIGEREMDRLRERVLGRVPARTEINRQLRPFMLQHALMHYAHVYGLLRV